MTIAAWITLGELLWVVGLSAWIILERRSPAATLAWVFALAWLPLVGVAVYLLIGPRRLRRKKLRYRHGRTRVEEASPHRRERAEAERMDAPQDGRSRPLVTLAQRAGQSAALRADGVELYASGDACYQALEQAIGQATHHVHLEYYIWEPDRTGTRFRDLLCDKARSGVEVRLLVDAIGSAWLSRRFLRPLQQAGAEVAWFNPISLPRFRPDLVNFRTHRKIVVCDGRIGFTGGINIAEEHSHAAVGPRAWRDTHLRIEGLPVGDLQMAFLEDWHFATGAAPSVAKYFARPHAAASGPWVQVLASGPDDDSHAIEKFYFAAIAGARRRVLLTTPYFVPNEAILSALMTAAMRGVEVRVLVPQRSDSRLVAAAARSYFEDLVRAGVCIHEYRPAMLHAKTLVADDVALVGSANLDNRSFRLNFEIAAAIYDEHVAGSLADLFCADLAQASEHGLRQARRTPLWQRMNEATARLLSPLL